MQPRTVSCNEIRHLRQVKTPADSYLFQFLDWSAALVGSVYVGPIVGAVFGCLWGGTVADKWALYLARRNNGIREPEQRLWPLAVAGVFSCAGLITWGVGADYGVHWIGLVFGL